MDRARICEPDPGATELRQYECRPGCGNIEIFQRCRSRVRDIRFGLHRALRKMRQDSRRATPRSMTAARTHRIIRICERQGVPVLADRAYMGAGPCM